MTENAIVVPSFITYMIGIIVYFLGMHLSRRVRFLREYNIPEPVVGGVVAALIGMPDQRDIASKQLEHLDLGVATLESVFAG